MTREIELKLQVAPSDLVRLRRLQAVLAEGETASRPARRQMVSTYYDTADRRLRKARIALRVRRGGRQTIQTVKGAARAQSGLSDYAECNVAVPGPLPDLARIPDIAMRDAVIAACDGAALVPLFSTEIERTTRLVSNRSGGAVEVAFDRGAVVAGRRRAPISEIEFELKAGGIGQLFDLARRVAAGTAARLRSDTKAARGFRLIERQTPRPAKADDIAIPADASVEQAFQVIARGCLAHLVANEPAVSERRDPEAVHQMRVALRRFRSAIALFAELVRSDAGARMEDEARALGQLLGAARDLDVFEAEVFGPVAAGFAEDQAAFRAALAPVRRRRNTAYRQVLAYLDSPAYTAFLLDAGAWIEERPWRRPDDPDHDAALDRPVAGFASEMLGARYRKLCKHGRHLADLTPEARHDLRKRLKRFRYAVEFLASVVPGEPRKMLKRLARLQDALGVLNDGKTARALLDQLGLRARSGSHDWVAGAVLGWHAHAAQGHLARTVKLWKRFTKQEAFWRG